jgi:hypothetical protein
MPYVTVFDSASGEPIASTGSPTCTASESPNCIGTRLAGWSILSTATSDSGTVPTIRAAVEVASLKVTVAPWAEPATTWSFVMT